MKRLGTKAPLDRPVRIARRHEASEEDFERFGGDAKHPSQHFSDVAMPRRRAVSHGQEFRRHDAARNLAGRNEEQKDASRNFARCGVPGATRRRNEFLPEHPATAF